MEDLHLIILPILTLSMTVRSTVGFGEALIAMPLLTLAVGLDLAAPLVSLNSIVISGLILAQDRRQVQLGSVKWLLAGGVLGVPAGLLLLAGPFDRAIQLALAALLIAFSAFKLSRPTTWRLQSDRWALPFGFAAGLLGGMFNTAGPPLVIFGTLRGWPPERFRATLQGFFLPSGVLVALGHGVAGRWTAELGVNFLLGLPVVAAALALGTWLNRRISPGRFDRLVYMLLIVIGLALLGRNLAG